MPLTNFPNGVSSFGVPVFAAGEIPVTFGNYYYVSSVIGNAAYNGTDPSTPVATVMQAHAKCTAGNQDVIILLPGHAETLATAGAINLTKAGVQVIGVGCGSKQPQFTFGTAATTTILLAGANQRWSNTRLTAGFADVATAFVVSAADVTIDNNRFDESATDLNWLHCIKTSAVANAADGLQVLKNTENSVDAAALAFISILEATDRVVIADNYVTQASAADVGHFLIMGAFVMKHALIVRNVVNLTGDNNAQAVGVFMTGSSTTSTGVCAYNLVGQLDATSELFSTATLDFWHFENRMTGTIAKSGYVLPAIDS